MSGVDFFMWLLWPFAPVYWTVGGWLVLGGWLYDRKQEAKNDKRKVE